MSFYNWRATQQNILRINLLSFLLICGTRTYEWGIQWDSDSYVLLVQLDNHYINRGAWSTLVKGDPKAPFSIATTPRCRGSRYSFLWIAPLTLDPYFIMLSVKQEGIKYRFQCLWYDSTCIEPRYLGPLANSQTYLLILATDKSK